jgi:predicted phage tail protein
MRKVLLLGTLGDKYGSSWEIEANTYQEIFSCIEANYPSFRKDLIEIAEAGGDLDIQSGDKFLEVEDMFYPVDAETIVITPIPSGAKSGGAKILAAIAIVALAFILSPVLGPGGVYAAAAAGQVGATYFALTAAFLIAANLAIIGIMQLLAPDPSVDTNDQNYLFSRPENTVAEGNVVPVLFGEMIVGGVTISSGIGASYGPSGHVGIGGTPIIFGVDPIQFPFISIGAPGITSITPFYPPTPNVTENPVVSNPITIIIDTPYLAYDGTESR